MGSEHYCLRWNNHQSNLLGVFSQLLQDESLVDVTLACSEGLSIRAHKVVLSACSSYFRSLFVDHPNRHPIVILKDVCFAELRTLVEFMYRGEVNIEYCQLSALLKTAESLKVKGLAEMTHLRSADADDSTDARSRDERSGGGGGGADTRTTISAADDVRPPPQQMSPSPPPSSTTASATATAPPQPPPAVTALSLKRPPPADSESPPPPRQPPSPQLNVTAADMDNNTMDETMTPDQSRSPEPRCDDDDSRSSMQSSGPSDMTYRSAPLPPLPPHSPLAGPSGMPPVQQVPLSLKKEVDWDRNDDKSTTGESSSDYRHPHDPEVCLVEGVYAPHSRCMPFDQLSGSSSRSSTPFGAPWGALLPPGGGDSPSGHPVSLFGLLQHQGMLIEHLLPSAGAAGDSEPGTLRCPICLAGFPSPWLLEQHTALQHAGQIPRGVLPALGSPASTSESGSTAGGDEKPFRCDQCGQSYRYRSSYLKHREQNHRARLPADKLFTCDVCGMQFRYLKSFKKHRLNHALERLHNPFHRPAAAGAGAGGAAVASDYSMTTGGRGGSGREASGAAAGGSSRSDEVTSSSSNETATGAGRGGEGQSPYAPPPPDQDDTVDSLALSMENMDGSERSLINLLRLGVESDLRHRQPERRSFPCPFCGKVVRSKENLKLHVRKHTGERPFGCLFCGRAFGGKSDLTRHLRIHTGERPYHCEMCGKCFARADYLSKHLTTHIHNSHSHAHHQR
ncbi:zinc finger and BTB domain-containing protein 49 [Nilaparvata lugens]|uniref:zinc finger and BTB domain-containing protein 49 n=1 Tax=Nilaparvata lugens TaxID=108931 RepID=UPI00193E9B27|nr:zinc finger and BTB domain-containing protein 49 [Nilaparvata lugens]XP_039298494.1 zinc finger and BTB domain-containing protein 49 [Nilaparvata lugens]